MLIEFGRNSNQISHTFRHTDAEGLQRAEVRAAVSAHLYAMQADLPEGGCAGDVQVKGVRLEFRAYKFRDGNIHVGRITLR